MNHVNMEDTELVSRLKRLDAGGAGPEPRFDYHGMLDRHASRQSRVRRRVAIARGAAGMIAIAMIGVSAWHLGRTVSDAPAVAAVPTGHAPSTASEDIPEQRLVRADTWLALAALEEHIASIDDALSDARVNSPQGVEVARLERTRAELLDSYAHVRYADMVAVNF
jgi:hypothetical protein